MPHDNVIVRLESTIGVYGTGLLDAISDEDLKAEYQKQENYGVSLNPSIFANGDWTSLYGTTTHPKRFTYALSRGPLHYAAGAHAFLYITNVNCSNRLFNYFNNPYAYIAYEHYSFQ